MALPGVSIVICTHNGAHRLRPTLAHLIAQEVRPGLAWEVIVVDNASTDDTAVVAQATWPGPAPLRVVTEPRLGAGYARARGLDEARYDVVGFADDDNWLAPDWVQTAWDFMQAHPEVGACGSFSEAVFEGDAPPAWFAQHARSFAVGAQGPAGDMGTMPLWTAGLVVRTAAWGSVRAAGFEPMLIGQRGRTPARGEDTELCFVLHAAGWRLWYEPRLRLRHAIPASRLTWDYVRWLHYGFGAASVTMDHYYMAAQGSRRLRVRVLRFWVWRFVATAVRLASHLVRAAAQREGSHASLQAQIYRGRLRALLGECGRYGRRTRRAREAVRRLAAQRR